MDEREHFQEALQKILEAAQTALNYSEGDGQSPFQTENRNGGCTLRSLPEDLVVAAARTATKINPANQPLLGYALAAARDLDLSPARIAVLTTKYWGSQTRRLTVQFLDTPQRDLRSRILSHLNAWSRTCGISFVETQSTGQVRITRRQQGYWSYLGTDILHIGVNSPTMCLGGITMETSEAEYRRVVRHEAGHTLGFVHEHMRKELIARIDRDKAYRYFGGPPNYWSRAMVDAQVLTSLDNTSIYGTSSDEDSIMCYQLPGSITKDGRPIRGGRDINSTDAAFAARIYPQGGSALGAGLSAEIEEEPETRAASEDGVEYEHAPNLAEVSS